MHALNQEYQMLFPTNRVMCPRECFLRTHLSRTLYSNIAPNKTRFSNDLIALEFNDTSRLLGHFVSSLRDSEKKIESRGYEREGQGRKRKMKVSEETVEIRHPPVT